MTGQRGDTAEATALPAHGTGEGGEFDREMRFAVVMYGGVSLAVYINGVAQELLAMVRATAPRLGDPLTGEFDHRELRGTERVYRELGRSLGCRFVVDVLSGTSAGGINALYLAKALVRDQELDGVKRLWKEEADMELLLNDSGSTRDLPPWLRDEPPQSVLNGQRFYWRLLDALEDMDARPGTVESPYVGELDLFITTTDFDGVQLPLKLTDISINEPHHRKRFHFRYWKPGEPLRDADGHELQTCERHVDNAFLRENNPVLAFAARCTASFPAAFPPFKVDDVTPILQVHPAYKKRAADYGPDWRGWKTAFAEYPGDFNGRYFVDGGYLDNKPFEAAVQVLGERRRAQLPVDRKLIYIEPHPEERAPSDNSSRPDVIDTLLAVSSLPRVETIRAELEQLDRRNLMLGRVKRMADGIQADLLGKQRIGKAPSGRTPEAHDRREAQWWALRDLEDVIEERGPAYGGYHRLKVASVTEWLAKQVQRAMSECRKQPGHESCQVPSLRQLRKLIGAWRSANYVRVYTSRERWQALKATAFDTTTPSDHPPHREALLRSLDSDQVHEAVGLPATENRFLLDFDWAYRVRRLELLRLELHEVFKRQRQRRQGTDQDRDDDGWQPLDDEQWRAGLDGVKQLRAQLQWIHQEFLFVEQTLDVVAESSELLDACQPLCEETAQGRADQQLAGWCKRIEAQQAEGAVGEALGNVLGSMRTRLRAHFVELNERISRALPAPTTDGPLTGEGVLARVVAHLDQRRSYYEEYDMVRFPVLYCIGTEELDAVEVLRISAEDTALAGSRGARKLAGIKLAHFGAFFDAKWRENDLMWGRLDAAERLVTALAPNEQLRDLWLRQAVSAIVEEELGPLDAQAPPPLQELGRTVRERARVEPLASDRAVALAGRATWIVRDLIDHVAVRRGAGGGFLVKWLVRTLSVVWALIQLLVPQSLWRVLIQHWVQLGVLAGALLIASGTVFNSTEQRSFGVGVVIVGCAVLALTAAWRSWMAGYVGRVVLGALLVLLVSGATGLLVYYRHVAGVPPNIVDLQLAWTPEAFGSAWRGLSQAQRAAAPAALSWDYWFILSYSVALVGCCALIGALLWHVQGGLVRKPIAATAAEPRAPAAVEAARIHRATDWFRRCLVFQMPIAALFAGAFDVVENLLLARAFQAEVETDALLTVSISVAAALKFGLVALVLSFVVLGVLVAGVIAVAVATLRRRGRAWPTTAKSDGVN